MPERDIVIFLGAGFSYDAGLPVMSNFGTKSRKDFEGLEKHLPGKGNERDAAEMLIEAADYFYAFQDYCLRSPTVTWEDVDNMETLFCIAEAMKETNMPEIPLKLKGKPKPCTPDELIRYISFWLWKIYQQCPILNKDKNIYTDFFKLLIENNVLRRTTIITTNYDLIFEYISWKEEVPCAYPFKNLSTAVKAINVSDGPKTFVRLKPEDLDIPLVLCKLHGSVNFFENISNNETNKLCDNKLYIANDLGGNKDIGKSGKFENKPAIFAVDAITEIHKKNSQSMTPAIIPPTYAKLVGKEWLREVWNHALNMLSMANTILFIGYSMPLTDGFMSALIHTAFVTRKRRNRPKVFVIDPSPQVHKNYHALFGTSYQNIGHYPLYWALKTGELKRVLRNAK